MTRLWHSQAHMPSVDNAELVIERGDGSYVWDETGKRYLDVPASLWYCNVGHGRQEILDRVSEQMHRLAAYHTFQQFANRPALDLSERLAELAPVPNGRVYLANGGSDAIEFAAKLCRRYWDLVGKGSKRIVVSRFDAYHGLHTFGTSIAGAEFNRVGYGPLVADTVRIDARRSAALAELVAREGADRIAAFVCEPVIGGGGIIAPPAGYFDEIQAICRANDILLVVDEVITGFGRTGAMFASDLYKITPDILVFAKGVTSGYLPLSGAIVSERLAEPFWRPDSPLVFHHGVTYSGHPTACAAALANLDIIEADGLVERVASLEAALRAALEPLVAHPLVRAVRVGPGLLAGIELLDDASAQSASRVCLDAGVLMRTLSNATLQVSPPFVIEPSELDLIGETAWTALEALEAPRNGATEERDGLHRSEPQNVAD